ncbi:MAG: lantibiotic dehydratase family protein, partial [Pseudonocardiaceae bacterium]
MAWGALLLYKCVDAAMVRVAAHRSGLVVPEWPDLTGGSGQQVAGWRRWLEQVWAQDAIAAAVEVASPVLACRIREICAGHEQRVRHVRRVVVSVARYLLRMTSRATPFGLFAGVAPARFGSELTVRYGEDHHAGAQADAEWLAVVVTRLEGCAALRGRLPVVLNNLSFVRDGRLVVGCQQQPTEPSRTEPAEVSVRLTRAVETVRQAARSPMRVGELARKLTAEFPGTPESVIEGMLAELVAQRILVTSLRPPMTVTDPLAYVVGELAVVGAVEVPQVALLVEELSAVQAELSRHNSSSSPAVRRDLRTSTSRRMAAICTTGRPLTVDLRVDCAMVLPQAVAREAEAAVTALMRLTPYPSGPPVWQDYHSRFLDRYGSDALVPVPELLNTETGLGFPAGYRDSRLELSPSPLSERDRRLLALAQNAAMNQSVEVVIDEAVISDLMAKGFASAQVQPHTEVSFRVHSRTREAVDRGEFDLAVVAISRAAGTMSGRFLDLFEPGDQDRMVGAYARLRTVNDHALPVQVSCPPLHPRTANVARSPAILPHVVSLAEHHSGSGLIPLEDLAVGGDAERLYLMSLSRQCPVEPTVFNAVELTNAAHPLLRFLCEISTARTAACGPFSWGAASQLPFLPRLRYRRTILSPARWMLAATDLPKSDAPGPQWAENLADWRSRVHVPDT